MHQLLAYAGSDAEADALEPVAVALAQALRLGVGHRRLSADPARQRAVILRETSSAGVVLAVLPCPAGEPPALVADLLVRCPTPLVLVRPDGGGFRDETLSRVLVPLDGTEESATAVAGTLALFSASGVDIVVLHVFGEQTAPRFWDQAVHARRSWEAEFLARFCPEPGARLELRSGSPGAGILDVAASEHADLIALGWSQQPSEGRARTVRATLRGTTVPVLLVPVLPVVLDDGHRVPDAVGAA
jgi:nucleotide-binding universal stress UspA family protein